MLTLQGHEQAEGIQPKGVAQAETLKISVTPQTSEDIVECLFQEPPTPDGRSMVVDAIPIKGRQPPQILGPQNALVYQELRTDKQDVPGKCRIAAVWRIPSPCVDGCQGEHLPHALAGPGQKIHKGAGLGTEITQPMPGREGRYVGQHTATARGLHHSSPGMKNSTPRGGRARLRE